MDLISIKMYLILSFCLLLAINVNCNEWDGYHRQLDDELPTISWKDCGISSRNSDPSLPVHPNVSPRIEGPEFAKSGEFPWFAFLEITRILSNGQIYESGCGGSIINEWWVLTAAHCVRYKTIIGINVLIGSVNRSDSSVGRRIEVDRVVINNVYLKLSQSEKEYESELNELKEWELTDREITQKFYDKLEKYDEFSRRFSAENLFESRRGLEDLALLKLRERVVPVFNDTHYIINSICLPKTNITNTRDESLVIIGMGRTSLDEPMSTRLKKGVSFMLSPKECQLDFWDIKGIPRPVHTPRICLEYNNTPNSLFESTPCSGDSGSPGHQYYGNKAVQLGVAMSVRMSTLNCGSGAKYVRVSLHMPWIRSHIEGTYPDLGSFEAPTNHWLIVTVIVVVVIAFVIVLALFWILVTILMSRPRNP